MIPEESLAEEERALAEGGSMLTEVESGLRARGELGVEKHLIEVLLWAVEEGDRVRGG